MDRRLPRDEDGLAPDRRLRMAVGTGGGAAGGRPEALDAADGGAVERRVFVHATPRVVWATLHDPALTGVLFPELKLGPAAPAWPAAATTRSARARLGLLRDAARVESLEARPESRFRLRVTASGFDSEWSWRLEPVAGGTRVIHGATFEPFDRWTGILVRLGRASLASSGRVAPARAQGTRRGRPARDEPDLGGPAAGPEPRRWAGLSPRRRRNATRPRQVPSGDGSLGHRARRRLRGPAPRLERPAQDGRRPAAGGDDRDARRLRRDRAHRHRHLVARRAAVAAGPGHRARARVGRRRGRLLHPAGGGVPTRRPVGRLPGRARDGAAPGGRHRRRAVRGAAGRCRIDRGRRACSSGSCCSSGRGERSPSPGPAARTPERPPARARSCSPSRRA